jgi:tetratricopeptide (TPR) repeat protein
MGSIRLGMLRPFEALAKARHHLQRAMELDDTIAEAHCTLALIKIWYDCDWPGAEREFNVAIRLDPGQVTALLWQSLYLSAMGRHQEAIASVQRARDTEPLSPIVNMYIGVARTHAGQYDLAIRQLNETIELDPHSYRIYMFLGRALSGALRYSEALEAFKKAISINPGNLEALAFMGAAKAAAGDRPGALMVLEQVLAADSRTEPAILAACIYASLGDDSQMFHSLQKAVEKKSAPIYIVFFDDYFRKYESDPRFHSFLASVGLSHRAKI